MTAFRDWAKNLGLRHLKQHPKLYRFLRYGIYARLQSANRAKVFQKTYDKNLWGAAFSASGPGSSLEATEALPSVVKSLSIRSVLDIPCGDYKWMEGSRLPVDDYIGADIVGSLIEKNRKHFGRRGITFIQLDLLSSALPSVDLIFCRDCLVHMSFREIKRGLANIAKARPKFLLVTTFPDHRKNEDTVTPYWRALNLQIEPFNFPAPFFLVKDFSELQGFDEGKYLGLWRLDDFGVS